MQKHNSSEIMNVSNKMGKTEVSLNVYILLRLIFGREGDVPDSLFKALSKLDDIKAFDRVSQHRQYDPRLFPAFAHTFHLTYPWALTSSIHYINSMLMQVNVQGYHILCQSGIGPLFYPPSLSIQGLAPPQGAPFASLFGVKNSALL